MRIANAQRREIHDRGYPPRSNLSSYITFV